MPFFLRHLSIHKFWSSRELLWNPPPADPEDHCICRAVMSLQHSSDGKLPGQCQSSGLNCRSLFSTPRLSLGQRLATFPSLPVKVPFLLFPSQGIPFCQSGRPTLGVPKSPEAGHVGFVRTFLAAGLLIYLLVHSLPSVFILLSAQDKWLPYSAELQRLQSS